MFEKIKEKKRVKMLAREAADLAGFLKISPDAMNPFQELAIQLLICTEPKNADDLVLSNPYTRVDMATLAWCLCNNYFTNDKRVSELKQKNLIAFLDITGEMETILDVYLFSGFAYLNVVKLNVFDRQTFRRGHSIFTKALQNSGLDAFIDEAETHLIVPDYDENSFVYKMDGPVRILPFNVSNRISVEIRSWFSAYVPIFIEITERCIEWSLNNIKSQDNRSE